MDNNDVFKKLRVALQLRDDQIVEILELVNFRISKGEIGNFFRQEEHPKYVECGDQVLRNFLNGLVIYLRGTKENPKNPTDVLKATQANKIVFKPRPVKESTQNGNLLPKSSPNNVKDSKNKITPKLSVIENVKFKNGKKS